MSNVIVDRLGNIIIFGKKEVDEAKRAAVLARVTVDRMEGLWTESQTAAVQVLAQAETTSTVLTSKKDDYIQLLTEVGGGGVILIENTRDTALAALAAQRDAALLLLQSSGTPTGVVHPFMGLVAPAGFLLLRGQAIKRNDYAGLFAFIAAQFGSGTYFGAGDGSTTFNLPDGQGCTMVGLDISAGRVTAASGQAANAIGVHGGSELLQQHAHGARISNNYGGTVNSMVATSGGTGGSGTTSGGTGLIQTTTTGAGSSQNMPPFLVTNYIIKT